VAQSRLRPRCSYASNDVLRATRWSRSEHASALLERRLVVEQGASRGHKPPEGRGGSTAFAPVRRSTKACGPATTTTVRARESAHVRDARLHGRRDGRDAPLRHHGR
jgi:hypothetical protein